MAQRHPAPFHSLPIGSTFELHGNIWAKYDDRTASGIWPSTLPSTARIAADTVCLKS